MQFKTDTYTSYLKDISGVKFTNREIDIICCMLYGRSTKKIASMLSISPRTVEAHIHNITNKIGCSSKDHIVDFVEKSGSVQHIYQYYQSLLTHILFEQYLQKICVMNKHSIVCVTSAHDQTLIARLQKDLRLANIILTQENFKYKKSKPIHVVLDGLSAQNYYSFVFDLIKNVMDNPEIDNMSHDFQKESDALHVQHKAKSDLKSYESNKFLPVFFVLLSFILVCAFYGNFYVKAEHMGYHLRSDLIIPQKKVLLERPDIVQRMNNMFIEKKGGIKTIALAGIVGIGGAGKTVLARYYGNFVSDANVVWELNAEKIESLVNSFQGLAGALSKKNSTRQKELDSVLNIQELQERQKQLLSLIKAWLKEEQSWLLIYDNAENISDIKDYLPQDPSIWGNGKVIITTRNTHIQNTQYLTHNDVIRIDELSEHQKLMLFSKIYYGKLPDKLTLHEKQKTDAFLKNIPPFPLDVSSAAYYLQSTNTSFNQYLKNLQTPSIAFERAQQSLFKERGTYTKTRYSIITMCLQNILDVHPEFTDLALFISLLDSQNIPKSLLEHFKSVDEFIVNLKKYSLITSESSSALGATFSLHRSTQAIMLSYLIQKLDLEKNKAPLNNISHTLETYMDKIINEEDYTKLNPLLDHCEAFLNHHDLLTNRMTGSIESTLGEAYCYLGRYNQKTQKLLEDNLKKLEQHDTEKIPRSLVALGITTRYLGNIENGKNLLEKAIELYKKAQPNPIKFAQSLSSLGEMYRILGDYQKAIDLFEQSIGIYKNVNPHHIEAASVMRFLGMMYFDFGNYSKAKDLLEQSIAIYKKKPKNISFGFSMTVLGKVYRELGDYKQAINLSEQALDVFKECYAEKSHISWTKAYLAMIYTRIGEFNKAKDLLEDTLKIYTQHYGKDNIYTTWILGHLGDVYRELGDYKQAQALTERSFAVCKQQSNINRIDRGWNLLYVGKVYSALGDYEKAKDFLKECLAIYEKHYGAAHIQTARVMSALGEAYMLKPAMFEESEKTLNKAKNIFQKENHPDLMFTHELLGDLYAKKSEKAKSSDYYKRALAIGNTFLKKDSAHMIRLNKKRLL